MHPTTTEAEPFESLASLLERLGDISPRRVVLKPAPGKATEADLLRLHRRTDRLFELVEGTLVEKIMGFPEGCLAADIIRLLGRFLDEHDLGDIGGADAMVRLMPKLVRMPDVSFVRWEKLPGRQRPTAPIPDLVPDLAVEVLSAGNKAREIERKLKEYFLAGVGLVWLVDPRKRTVEACTAPDRRTIVEEGGTLDGGSVLPGLRLPVREVFARVPREAHTRKSKAPRRSRPRGSR